MNKAFSSLGAFFSGSAVFLCALGFLTCRLPAQTAALPGGEPLLGEDVRAFRAYGAGPETSASEVVVVEGSTAGIREALRLTTVKEPSQYYSYGATAALTAPVQKGDVLWVSLWARRLTTRRESGEALVEVAMMQKVDGKEIRPLERVLSVGTEWTQFTLPFTVKNDSEVGQAKLGFRYGYGPQSVEVGGLQLLNYGSKVKPADLPRTVVRYDGSAPDAPWRQAAAERIEKLRKGDLLVRVTDAAGTPVPDAQVQVRMKRHAFGWGTAIDEARLTEGSETDVTRFKETLTTYFNKVVFENSLKWPRWINPERRAAALAAMPWLEEQGFTIRGHVLVWPSWQNTPKALRDLRDNPAALAQAVADRIAEQTRTFEGRLPEWDVINETYKHHDLLDILGRDVMVNWFKLARAGAPDTKLFYNDYTMFHRGEGQQYFYDTIKFLKERGAPIDAIGEQGHFASSPPGIPDVLASLDRFGELGLPIQITEFDIDTDDAGLQAEFMRDFTTAAFSHPSVMGVLHWGFWEKAHWLPRSALWDKDWNLRPHGQVWVDLVRKTWWTNADGRTGAEGGYATRGFLGDYEVTATQGEKTRTVKFALSPKTGVCTVVLP